MPIHVDDEFASSVGLPGIIAHGLCTMAMCSQAVIATVAGGDPTRLRRLAVRFAANVFPGNDVVTTVYEAGSADGARVYAFEAASDGALVVKHGLAGDEGGASAADWSRSPATALVRRLQTSPARPPPIGRLARTAAVLRLFAQAREAAGTGRDLVDGATVDEVLARGARPLRRRLRRAARVVPHLAQRRGGRGRRSGARRRRGGRDAAGVGRRSMTDRDIPDAWWGDESPIGTDRRRDRVRRWQRTARQRRPRPVPTRVRPWAPRRRPRSRPDPRTRPAARSGPDPGRPRPRPVGRPRAPARAARRRARAAVVVATPDLRAPARGAAPVRGRARRARRWRRRCTATTPSPTPRARRWAPRSAPPARVARPATGAPAGAPHRPQAAGRRLRHRRPPRPPRRGVVRRRPGRHPGQPLHRRAVVFADRRGVRRPPDRAGLGLGELAGRRGRGHRRAPGARRGRRRRARCASAPPCSAWWSPSAPRARPTAPGSPAARGRVAAAGIMMPRARARARRRVRRPGAGRLGHRRRRAASSWPAPTSWATTSSGSGASNPVEGPLAGITTATLRGAAAGARAGRAVRHRRVWRCWSSPPWPARSGRSWRRPRCPGAGAPAPALRRIDTLLVLALIWAAAAARASSLTRRRSPAPAGPDGGLDLRARSAGPVRTSPGSPRRTPSSPGCRATSRCRPGGRSGSRGSRRAPRRRA